MPRTFYRHCSGMAALVLLLVTSMAGCATRVPEQPTLGTPSHTATPLQAADTMLLQGARAVARIASRMEGVWQGFWSPDEAFILYRPGESVLLVSPAAPPAGFIPIDGLEVPPELEDRVYLHRGTLPGLEASYHIDFPAGSTTAIAVALDPEGIRPTLTTLFHEAFHGFQRRRFATTPLVAGEFVDPSHLLAPRFRALTEVERKLLTMALDLPADELPEHLRQYLAVRLLRIRSVPADVQALERHLERVEGSAELVGLEAGLLASAEGRTGLPEALRPHLTRPLDSVPGGVIERLIRWRVYGTGAAIGFLLDRLGTDWRPRLEEGATFDELLGMAVDFDTTAAPALAMQVLERLEFEDRLAAEAMAATSGAQLRSVEDFYSLAPARLVVEFAVPIVDGRPSMSINFSSGNEGFSQLEPNVIAIPDPEVFTLQVPQGSLVVHGLPVLQDVRDIAEQRLRITVLLPAGLTTADTVLLHSADVDGRRPLPEGEYHRERLNLELDGVELRFNEPVRVQVGPNEWFIQADVAETAGS